MRSSHAFAEGPLIVHEWGTFTSLQDESGRTLFGINADDEPVPSFVHRLWGKNLIGDARLRERRPLRLAQGAPELHPDVAMRMETPVVYFHLPAGVPRMSVDLSVTFRQGWITEYFPQGDIAVEGSIDRDRIGPSTATTLTWRDLEISDGFQSGWPDTDDHVWLAPRNVASAPMRAKSGEAEKYLFYRGVGRELPPIQIVRSNRSFEIKRGRRANGEICLESIGPMWLVDIQPDGRSFYRRLAHRPDAGVNGSTTIAGCELPHTTSAAYRDDGVERLRAEMLAALQDEGLFADEAAAMLETWSLSYFASSGVRVFYLLGRDWTDSRLPLTVQANRPVEIVRAMMGRLECITPWQRRHLQKVIDMPAESQAGQDAFQALGRFRQAILVDYRERNAEQRAVQAFEGNRTGPVAVR